MGVRGFPRGDLKVFDQELRQSSTETDPTLSRKASIDILQPFRKRLSARPPPIVAPRQTQTSHTNLDGYFVAVPQTTLAAASSPKRSVG
jgi:hypothetical protein